MEVAEKDVWSHDVMMIPLRGTNRKTTRHRPRFGFGS